MIEAFVNRGLTVFWLVAVLLFFFLGTKYLYIKFLRMDIDTEFQYSTLNIITVPLSLNIHMTTTCNIDSNLEKKVRKYHLLLSQYLLIIIKINIFLHTEGKHLTGTLIKYNSCSVVKVKRWFCELRGQGMTCHIQFLCQNLLWKVPEVKYFIFLDVRLLLSCNKYS
jgi:hypothetical protein